MMSTLCELLRYYWLCFGLSVPVLESDLHSLLHPSLRYNYIAIIVCLYKHFTDQNSGHRKALSYYTIRCDFQFRHIVPEKLSVSLSSLSFIDCLSLQLPGHRLQHGTIW